MRRKSISAVLIEHLKVKPSRDKRKEEKKHKQYVIQIREKEIPTMNFK